MKKKKKKYVKYVINYILKIIKQHYKIVIIHFVKIVGIIFYQ